MSAIIESVVIHSDLESAQAPRFAVSFAMSEAEIRESQQLRFRIFAGELGAQIDGQGQLKAYLSLGAKACGEAYWDRDFNCADVFMLLNVTDLNPRYARHFLDRVAAAAEGIAAGHA